MYTMPDRPTFILVVVGTAGRADTARDVIGRCGGEARDPEEHSIYGMGVVATPY